MSKENRDVSVCLLAQISRHDLDNDTLEIVVASRTNGWEPAGVVGRHRPFDAEPPFGRRLNYAILSWVLVALLSAASSAAQARIINAASPSLADVRRAINSAADGDTVMVPAGTAAWTSTVRITKGISLVGQTTTDPVAKTANDQTIILVNTGTNGNTPLMILDTAPGKSYRLSGITFRTGQTSVVNSNGMVILGGNSHSVRVDHCHFDDLAYENNNIAVWGPIYGVIDHNIFDFRNANNTAQAVFIAMPDWGAPNNQYGDGSWAEPAYFGSEKFVFMEDNCFNNTSGNEFAGVIDDRQGGRWVYRHNHAYNTCPQSHGTEIGRYRGGRCREVYNNDFHWTIARHAGGMRSGGFITHDNTHDGVMPLSGPSVGAYRVFITIPVWGGASGDNPWDYNVTEPDGAHVDGHPPYLFASGTAGTGSGQDAIVDTTKNWTPNQWTGFTAKRVSDNGVALIHSNTNNTLKVYYHSGYGGGVSWRAGDKYQIHRVLIAMDQACRGAGDLLIGDLPPINATTRRASWPHQALEPCYSWNDIYTPTNAHINIHTATGAFAVLAEGRDFYNNTPMPGYTPYTYPHPLTTGAQSTASASSPHDHPKKEKKKWGKVKTWKWGKAKENSANDMAERIAPDQPSK
jgi:hypothetical protein